MNPQNLHAHEDRLLDFAYGELPVPEARVVEAHVQGCARCTQALADIRGVRATMSQLSTEPAPDAGLESLMAYAQQAARRASAGPAPKPSRWRRWLLPVVGLASVSTFGILTFQAKSPDLTRPSLREAAVAQTTVADSAPVASAPAAEPPLAMKVAPSSARPLNDSAPADAEFGKGAVGTAQPQRADNWKDSGSGGGLDARLVPEGELKAKRERARSGPSKSVMMKQAPVAPSPSAEKADQDEAQAQGGKLAYARDSLRLGGTAREEIAADDETADGLSVPEAEAELAAGAAYAPAPTGAVAAAPAPVAAASAPALEEAPQAERRAPSTPAPATKAPAKKSKWYEPVTASAAPAMPPPPPAQAAPKEGPSVAELSRMAQEANRGGHRDQEAALLRSALLAGASGQERLDLLNRLCDAELALGRQAAGTAVCNQVISEAPESSAAQRARRRLSQEASSNLEAPAKAAEPSK